MKITKLSAVELPIKHRSLNSELWTFKVDNSTPLARIARPAVNKDGKESCHDIPFRLWSLRVMALLLIPMMALASSTDLFAQGGSPSEAVIFDFNFSNGEPLVGGQIISSVTVDDLTMAVNVESNGDNNVGMIFDTSNPGPDPDLGTPNEGCPGGGPGVGDGGSPGTIGENCVPLGNVLIIPRDVGPNAIPNDDSAGGVISLTFSEPVRVLEIHILDIDEENSAPKISFWDIDGNPTLEDIQPQVVGNNGHEQFSSFSDVAAASVVTIQVTFPGSGALDSIIVAPAPPDGGIDIIKYVNGFDANDPTGTDVPRLALGETVIWTYHVTNTGEVAYPLAQVIVTDSDAAVMPSFSQVLTGNADQQLEPGEVWEFIAQSQAIGLTNPNGNPSVEANLCPSDNVSTPPDQNGYKNIGTVTVPDADDSDPAHYCGKKPGLLIRKFVDGNDANDPAGTDVPRYVPGQMVTWTYRLTNTGEIPYAIDELDVADSDPDVVPLFDMILLGDDDEILEPGEVWQYVASKEALDLRNLENSSLVIKNGCPGIDLDNDGSNAYQNIGSITAPGAGDQDPANYCNIIPDLDAGRNEAFALSYTVVNDGPVPVGEIQVFAGPNVAVTCPANTLIVGESMICPAVASDIGFRNSLGWVVAQPINGGPLLIRAVSPDSTARLSVVVEVNGQRANEPSGPTVDLAVANGTAALAAVVTNDGNVNLNGIQVAVADQDLSCVSTALAPGQSTSCALTINIQAGPQVLIGGVSALPAGEATESNSLSQELRVYMIGQ